MATPISPTSCIATSRSASVGACYVRQQHDSFISLKELPNFSIRERVIVGVSCMIRAGSRCALQCLRLGCCVAPSRRTFSQFYFWVATSPLLTAYLSVNSYERIAKPPALEPAAAGCYGRGASSQQEDTAAISARASEGGGEAEVFSFYVSGPSLVLMDHGGL